jgi:hypothetical protein
MPVEGNVAWDAQAHGLAIPLISMIIADGDAYDDEDEDEDGC